jgi:hypothetical protein
MTFSSKYFLLHKVLPQTKDQSWPCLISLFLDCYLVFFVNLVVFTSKEIEEVHALIGSMDPTVIAFALEKELARTRCYKANWNVKLP